MSGLEIRQASASYLLMTFSGWNVGAFFISLWEGCLRAEIPSRTTGSDTNEEPIGMENSFDETMKSSREPGLEELHRFDWCFQATASRANPRLGGASFSWPFSCPFFPLFFLPCFCGWFWPYPNPPGPVNCKPPAGAFTSEAIAAKEIGTV